MANIKQNYVKLQYLKCFQKYQYLFVCKQLNSFENKINYKLFTYKSYMYFHLILGKQMLNQIVSCTFHYLKPLNHV